AEAVNYRLFNQTIDDAEGDRIRVLEDTDGDGHCDKAWTYYQDPSLQSPMGIAVLGERVYVCQSPDLFYLEDTDGDGRADKRTVILTGFGGVDHDHAVHGVIWGPDGKLYFSVGDQGLDVTDGEGHRFRAGRDAPFQAATVWRTDLEGKRLELLASNMRNPYEPAVDSYGRVFISDNDDDGNENTRINYVMEGGNYGYWPHRNGDRHLESVHWNMDRPGTIPRMIRAGFGSPTGLLSNEGTDFPGELIHADAGPGEIRSFHVIPDGAGYRAEKEILLTCPEDRWFRPSDVCLAPDGSLFISDWYDQGVGGHRMADTAQGRIYRLTKKGKSYISPSVKDKEWAAAFQAFLSPNVATRYRAYTILPKSQTVGHIASIKYDPPSLFDHYKFVDGTDDAMKARVYWLSDLLGRDESPASSRVNSALLDEQSIRRFFRGFEPMVLDAFDPIYMPYLKLDERSDPAVARQFLIEAAPFATDSPTLPVIMFDVAAKFDGRDRFYREAIGIAFRGRESWAFDTLRKKLGDTWDLRMAQLALQLHPAEAFAPAAAALNDKSLDVDLREIAMRTLDMISTPEAGQAIASQLTSDATLELQKLALELLGFDEGGVWRKTLNEIDCDAYLAKAAEDPRVSDAAWGFVRGTHRASFLFNAATLALDAGRPAATRAAALEVVPALAVGADSNKSEHWVETFSPLLGDVNADIQRGAAKAIGTFASNAAWETLTALITDAKNARELRLEALQALARKPAGAMKVIALAEKDSLPLDLTLAASELLNDSRSEDVRMLASQVLPRESARGGQQLPPLAELVGMSGEAAKGRAVFYDEAGAQCYTCHRVQGQGKQVGPDLSTIGQKYGRQGLLESILNPNAAIGHEYQVTMVETKNGDVAAGFVRNDSDSALDLMDSAGETQHIAPGDIVNRWISEASLMPTGLASGMTAQELVDLVTWLETLR
ncbi:MAG: PVC-type heme-binding CxxCH protein, partial [Candidatus Hydrogenedentota bacterium]